MIKKASKVKKTAKKKLFGKVAKKKVKTSFKTACTMQGC